MNEIPKLIVIIEDDFGLRRAVERLVRLAGYDARVFADGEDADAFAFASSAACLVLDVQLPGLNGPAFYSTLPIPRPPAVFITAFDTAGTRNELTRVGPHRMLKKPFLGTELLDELARAINPQAQDGAQ